MVFSAGALCVLALSFILPVEGLFLNVCTFKAVSGFPCPGCGLTRSIISISHLHLLKAFRLNPMGFPIYSVILFLSAYNFLPKAVRERVDRFLIRHERIWAIAGLSAVALLIIIWIFRMIVVRGSHAPVLEEL